MQVTDGMKTLPYIDNKLTLLHIQEICSRQLRKYQGKAVEYINK